jgi:hypothetical protein
MILAAWAAYFGDSNMALSFLRQVNSGPGRSRWTAVFKETRQLPEFKDHMRELRFVDYWRTNGWGDFCRPAGSEDFACN